MNALRHVMATASCLVLMLGGVSAGEPRALEREDQKVGYSVGFQVGGDLRRQGIEVDPEMVVRGVVDALDGTEPVLTADEMERALIILQRHAEEIRERRRSERAERNRADGAAFLAENAKREGVVVLPSGLQYRVLEPGSGSTPSPTDTVTIVYRGMRLDGTVFDSSAERGESATFRVDTALPGWREALGRMSEGARWKLFLPAALAYGSDGAERVGPETTVIFEIALIAVHPDGPRGDSAP